MNETHTAGGCTCRPIAPDWPRHGGGIEPSPGCPVHDTGKVAKWADLFGIAPDFTGDLSTDEYLAEQRGETP